MEKGFVKKIDLISYENLTNELIKDLYIKYATAAQLEGFTVNIYEIIYESKSGITQEISIEFFKPNKIYKYRAHLLVVAVLLFIIENDTIKQITAFNNKVSDEKENVFEIPKQQEQALLYIEKVMLDEDTWKVR